MNGQSMTTNAALACDRDAAGSSASPAILNSAQVEILHGRRPMTAVD